jgi:hypothetical protein
MNTLSVNVFTKENADTKKRNARLRERKKQYREQRGGESRYNPDVSKRARLTFLYFVRGELIRLNYLCQWSLRS